jgi:hypothetical protein
MSSTPETDIYGPARLRYQLREDDTDTVPTVNQPTGPQPENLPQPDPPPDPLDNTTMPRLQLSRSQANIIPSLPAAKHPVQTRFGRLSRPPSKFDDFVQYLLYNIHLKVSYTSF